MKNELKYVQRRDLNVQVQDLHEKIDAQGHDLKATLATQGQQNMASMRRQEERLARLEQAIANIANNRSQHSRSSRSHSSRHRAPSPSHHASNEDPRHHNVDDQVLQQQDQDAEQLNYNKNNNVSAVIKTSFVHVKKNVFAMNKKHVNNKSDFIKLKWSMLKGNNNMTPNKKRPPQASHQQNRRNEDDNHHQQPRNHNEDQDDARPLHRCNVRDEEEIFGKLKFTIPIFKGEDNPEAYLSWVHKVDKIFRIHNYSNAKKVAMASLEFEDYASVWWDELNDKHEANLLEPIETWEEMKEVMHTRFVPSHHKRDLFNKLTQLKQSFKSVEEYKDMHMTMVSANVDEREEQTMARSFKMSSPMSSLPDYHHLEASTTASTSYPALLLPNRATYRTNLEVTK
ncbi:hypothetical protein QYE76_022820 [Lolium multiflorum]|uniref:Retrotransposon gag domain-containing protein n=1 Tax=Lolium multiflorum TaxID=4521 RepID=A0AAD8R926_LOLMU|nr:hypothetical protein QYE76_022820 [Lolium multiflorum]